MGTGSATVVPDYTLEDFMADAYNANKYTGVRNPGTLTVRVGEEIVTLDPMDPPDKFDRCKAEVERLLRLFTVIKTAGNE